MIALFTTQVAVTGINSSLYIPINHDFHHKKSNHKTDKSMKIDQSVRLFKSNATISHAQNIVFMILLCTDRIELYIILSQIYSLVQLYL